jgi:hypothetical protein
MKNTIYFILILLGLFILNSCSREDIQILPQGKETDATFYQTEGQLKEALYACYNPLTITVWNGSTFMWGSITSDDAVAGGADLSDTQDMQWADRFIIEPYDAKDDNFFQYYKKWYSMNTRCNYLLKYANQETDFGKSVVAQANFLKGYAYFMLTRMFGRCAIIDKIPDVNDKFPLSQQADVYAAIENYLKTAIDMNALQARHGFSEPTTDGQATIAAAQALMGKILVNEASLLNKPEKYTEAIPYLLAVANSGNYELEENYDTIFKPSNQHGKESIFEINFTQNGPSHGFNEFSVSNSVNTVTGPRTGEIAIPGPMEWGWGLNQPTQKLAAAFDAMGDVVRKKSSIISTDSIASLYVAAGEAAPVMQNELTGYWDLKHVRRDGYFSAPDGVGQNTIVLRLSDVYLLLAEAYFKTNDETNAKLYLNKVRERAKLAPSTASGADLLQTIKNERQVELCLEGDRYFDLVRWGDAAKELTGEDYSNEANLGNNYVTGKPGVATNGLFPIPYQELATDPGIGQNTGY